MKHSFALVACVFLLTLSLALSGCTLFSGTPQEKPPKNTESTSGEDTVVKSPIDNALFYETVSDAYLESIPREDYNGASFLITAPRTDVLFPDDTALVYSAKKHERNQRVEDLFELSLTDAIIDENTFPALVRASMQAEEYYSDLLMIPQYQIGAFVANGSLLNLNSLPFLDLSKPYFNADSIEAATVNKAIYAAAGAASFEPATLTAVFLNRDLFTENNLPLPYEKVKDGTWTWDALLALGTAVSEINANSGKSLASYCTEYAADTLASAIFFSAGGKFVRQNDDAPYIAYSETDRTAASFIEAVFSDKNVLKGTSAVSRFYAGESLFLLDRLYLMDWMINGRVNWGIVPLPKESESQKDYVSLSDECALFFATPRNNIHAARTAHILSALNAAHYGVINDAYITHTLYHTVRDNDTANMLGIIMNSRTYDFAFSFGRTDETLAKVSYLGMNELVGNRPFDDFLKRITETDTHLKKAYAE